MTRWHNRLAVPTVAMAVMALGLAAWGGVAMANSSPYQPNQNDCQWNSDAWNTQGQYAGCHSAAVNVESGGTTNGNVDPDNTRYVEWGNNQNPVDPASQGTPTELSLAYPGNTGEPHAGCLGANTDGTGGGPAPAWTSPEASQQAEQTAEDDNYGCGNNPDGAGFEANYDTFGVYCPFLAMVAGSKGTITIPDGGGIEAGSPSGNDQVAPCEDSSYGAPLTVTPDTGTAVDYEPIVDNGVIVYYGMDDNTDNTEHDGYDGCGYGPDGSTDSNTTAQCQGTGQGCPKDAQGVPTDPNCNPAGQTDTDTDGAINGPSDGGGFVLSLTPQSLLETSPPTPTATNPEGAANYSEGECADGICGSATTQQYTPYYGCVPSSGPDSSRGSTAQSGTDGATDPENDQADDQCAPGTASSTDSFENNVPADTEESPDCNGGGPYATAAGGTEEPCSTDANGTANPGGADYYRQTTPSQVNDEPGVETYEDPDPERSPAAPFGTPGTYVGTCGVYLNDGPTAYGEGVSGTLTDGASDQTDPASGTPFDDPGWVVGGPSGLEGQDPDGFFAGC